MVDDGSVDGSFSYVQSHFRNGLLFKNEIGKKGVSSARNLGIRHAKGKWIAFLDADDIWEKDKLSKQINALKGLKWSHTDSYYFGHNQDGKKKRSDFSTLKGGDVFNSLLLDNFITTSGVLVEKDLLLSFGGFDETFEMLEDWKLWLDLASQEHISYCDLPLVRYRVTPGSTSRRAKKVYPFHVRIISENNKRAKKTNLLYKYEALANSNNICSYIAEDSSDFGYAIVCAIRALCYCPIKLSYWKRPISVLLGYARYYKGL